MNVARAALILKLIEQGVRREMGEIHSTEDVVGQATDKLWDRALREEWSNGKIIGFAKYYGRWGRLEALSRKEVSASDLQAKSLGDGTGDAVDPENLFYHLSLLGKPFTAAMQHVNLEAKEARAWMGRLPDDQRQALLILCEGGNPLDVAEEMNMTPREALLLIYDARKNIHRV